MAVSESIGKMLVYEPVVNLIVEERDSPERYTDLPPHQKKTANRWGTHQEWTGFPGTAIWAGQLCSGFLSR